MAKKKAITPEEQKAINEINKTYHDGISVLLEDYRVSNVKIKKSHKRTVLDKIIDMFIDGDCSDTISKELRMDRVEVDKILLDYGAI